MPLVTPKDKGENHPLTLINSSQCPSSCCFVINQITVDRSGKTSNLEVISKTEVSQYTSWEITISLQIKNKYEDA